MALSSFALSSDETAILHAQDYTFLIVYTTKIGQPSWTAARDVEEALDAQAGAMRRGAQRCEIFRNQGGELLPTIGEVTREELH